MPTTSPKVSFVCRLKSVQRLPDVQNCQGQQGAPEPMSQCPDLVPERAKNSLKVDALGRNDWAYRLRGEM
eukprot:6192868-Pleurochrysis_carterae.AAC.5